MVEQKALERCDSEMISDQDNSAKISGARVCASPLYFRMSIYQFTTIYRRQRATCTNLAWKLNWRNTLPAQSGES
jgi:hypothetical protein